MYLFWDWMFSYYYSLCNCRTFIWFSHQIQSGIYQFIKDCTCWPSPVGMFQHIRLLCKWVELHHTLSGSVAIFRTELLGAMRPPVGKGLRANQVLHLKARVQSFGLSIDSPCEGVSVWPTVVDLVGLAVTEHEGTSLFMERVNTYQL